MRRDPMNNAPASSGGGAVETKSSNVWENQSAQWERVGSPLRPSPDDESIRRSIVEEYAEDHGSLRVLVLGVTPELTRMVWPHGTRLLAADISPKMIGGVWEGSAARGDQVVCADWLRMPLRNDSRSMVDSDGCFGVIPHFDDYHLLLTEIRRVLRPDGILVFRVFVQPEQRESSETVVRDAMNGEIDGFHAFKLRLLMSLQPDSSRGVRTGDVWDFWSKYGPGAEVLASRLQWPLEQIETINAYRGQDTIYSFPKLSELRGALEGEGFRELRCVTPAYELGERCPTLAWSRST